MEGQRFKRDVIILIGSVFLVLFLGTVIRSNRNEVNVQPVISLKDTVEIKGLCPDPVNLYDTAIMYLKKCEGFVDTVYKDNDGSPTIGYGHHILPGENYVRITQKKAEEILKEDLDYRIKVMQEHTGLKGAKALALGLLAFNLGEGKVKYYIKRNNLLQKNNIRRILRYCHYKKIVNGKTIVIRSNALYKRREFELYLFNYKMDLSTQLQDNIKRLLHEDIAGIHLDTVRTKIEDYLDHCENVACAHIGVVLAGADVIIARQDNNNLTEARELYTQFMEEYNALIDG